MTRLTTTWQADYRAFTTRDLSTVDYVSTQMSAASTRTRRMIV